MENIRCESDLDQLVMDKAKIPDFLITGLFDPRDQNRIRHFIPADIDPGTRKAVIK